MWLNASNVSVDKTVSSASAALHKGADASRACHGPRAIISWLCLA